MTPRPDPNSSSVISGYAWASRIIGLGLQLVLPILGGWWLDREWETEPAWLLGGALLGIAIFGLSIVKLSREISKKRTNTR